MAECAICGGTGWKVVQRGGLSGAAPCECQLAARVSAAMKRSGIPERFADSTFRNFSTRQFKADAIVFVGFVGAVLSGIRYANEFSRSQDPPGLLFCGPPGTGKTHLATAALKSVIERGTRGVFLDCGNLLEQVKATFGQKEAGRAEAARVAVEYDIVLLDDLGAQQQASDWARDTIASVISSRYNERKPTLVTTGLEQGSLSEKLGPAVASRLREMCKFVQLPLGASDYRKRRTA